MICSSVEPTRCFFPRCTVTRAPLLVLVQFVEALEAVLLVSSARRREENPMPARYVVSRRCCGKTRTVDLPLMALGGFSVSFVQPTP
jgi:hypothetical protein